MVSCRLLQFRRCIDTLRVGEGTKLSLMRKSDFLPSPHLAAPESSAIAQAVGDKVEAAYRRGKMRAKRHELMRDWERFCAGTVR
jgi:hypothetical protein